MLKIMEFLTLSPIALNSSIEGFKMLQLVDLNNDLNMHKQDIAIHEIPEMIKAIDNLLINPD